MFELLRIVHNFVSKTSIYKRLIGLMAIGFGIVSFIPIMIKMWKTRDADNFTNINLTLAFISNLFLIYYGNIANTVDNIISGILYFLIYLYIFIIKNFF